MRISLGISSNYHDSSAVIIKDGEIVAAAQEEWFSRNKHDPGFPSKSIEYCLSVLNVSLSEVNCVAYHEDPLLKSKRRLKYSQNVNDTQGEIFTSLLSDLNTELQLRAFGKIGSEDKLYYTTHHHSHALSAFFPSPFSESAVLVLDGVGEEISTSIWKGTRHGVELVEAFNLDQSLGLFYSAMTYYCGFKVNSGEYKLMGLAPYGDPIYVTEIERCIFDANGFLNRSFVNIEQGAAIIHEKSFIDTFGNPKRSEKDDLTKFYLDFAASAQRVLENKIFQHVRRARELTGSEYLCMAGGVALNCTGNGKIYNSGIFKDVWIQPAAGDAGCALGAAIFAYMKNNGESDEVCQYHLQQLDQSASLLGPTFNTNEYLEAVDHFGLRYEKLEEEECIVDIAQSIKKNLIVAHHHGRQEYGPRALGNRSVLASPLDSLMQKKINLNIKNRESFRPFAPIVREDVLSEFFDTDKIDKYMLFVFPVKSYRETKANSSDIHGRLYGVKSDLPSITHVDGSARVQSVNERDHSRVFKVLNELEKLNHPPVIINTSFNVRGEPIVLSPTDAIECFVRAEIDVLYLDSIVIRRKNNLPLIDQIRKTLPEIDPND